MPFSTTTSTSHPLYLGVIENPDGTFGQQLTDPSKPCTYPTAIRAAVEYDLAIDELRTQIMQDQTLDHNEKAKILIHCLYNFYPPEYIKDARGAGAIDDHTLPGISFNTDSCEFEVSLCMNDVPNDEDFVSFGCFKNQIHAIEHLIEILKEAQLKTPSAILRARIGQAKYYMLWIKANTPILVNLEDEDSIQSGVSQTFSTMCENIVNSFDFDEAEVELQSLFRKPPPPLFFNSTTTTPSPNIIRCESVTPSPKRVKHSDQEYTATSSENSSIFTDEKLTFLLKNITCCATGKTKEEDTTDRTISYIRGRGNFYIRINIKDVTVLNCKTNDIIYALDSLINGLKNALIILEQNLARELNSSKRINLFERIELEKQRIRDIPALIEELKVNTILRTYVEKSIRGLSSAYSESTPLTNSLIMKRHPNPKLS